MKNTILPTLFALLIASASAFAQSKSFVTLKDKFRGEDEVHHFAVSGFFARSILWMADEHEFYKAIKEVKTVRLIVIPRQAFVEQQVTVNGFKKVLLKDGFEELARVKDRGDDVTLYHQSSAKKKDRYFMIVEESDEIVAIEMNGDIDPQILLDSQSISLNN